MRAFITSTVLARLEVEIVGADRPAGDPVVVLLHGFEMQPGDLSPFAASLTLPVRFLFPRAPLDLGPRLRGFGWWDIDIEARDVARARGEPRDLAELVPEGLAAACMQIAELIDTVRATLQPRVLVLGGVSQGAMLSLDVALHATVRPTALLLLSGTRLAARLWAPLLPRLAGCKVFQSHGRADPDLSYTAAERLRDDLTAAGAQVSWLAFDGGHQTPLPVWRHVRLFLTKIVAQAAGASQVNG